MRTGAPALTGLSGQVPAISPAALRQIGIRSLDKGEIELVHTPGLAVGDMQALRTLGLREVMMRAPDVMELNPALDSIHATVEVTVGLVAALLADRPAASRHPAAI